MLLIPWLQKHIKNDSLHAVYEVKNWYDLIDGSNYNNNILAILWERIHYKLNVGVTQIK